MSYRINHSTCLKNPGKFYHKVICHCFGAQGQAQALIMTDAELAKHEVEIGPRERLTDDEYWARFGHVTH